MLQNCAIGIETGLMYDFYLCKFPHIVEYWILLANCYINLITKWEGKKTMCPAMRIRYFYSQS